MNVVRISTLGQEAKRRDLAPPEQVREVFRAAAQEGVGVGVEELGAPVAVARHVVALDQDAGGLAGGADIGDGLVDRQLGH